MLRITAWIMLHLILLAFAWQWNDPDGPLWMLIYGYAAVVTAMAIERKVNHWALVGLVGYLAGFAYLAPAFRTQRYWYDVEPVREALGLLILAAWMLVLTAAWLKRRSSEKRSVAL